MFWCCPYVSSITVKDSRHAYLVMHENKSFSRHLLDFNWNFFNGSFEKLISYRYAFSDVNVCYVTLVFILYYLLNCSFIVYIRNIWMNLNGQIFSSVFIIRFSLWIWTICVYKCRLNINVADRLFLCLLLQCSFPGHCCFLRVLHYNWLWH